jgi:selenocysteine lyase/cysteine desulfurase
MNHPSITLEEYRAHFAEPPGYCDFARIGPPSLDVVTVAHQLWQALAEGAVTVEELQDEERQARDLAARLTGRPGADRVVLVPHTSGGLFQVAFGLAARHDPGEVLVAAGEFPANVYPWVRAASFGGPRVRLVHPPDGRVTPDGIRQELRPETVALTVSAVDYRTGYCADLPGLRDVLGDRLLVVDAIQGFGVAAMDWHVADAVVTGGQKWLRAGWGTGFLSLSERALDRLGEGLIGWYGVVDAGRFDATLHPARADAGRFSETAPDLVASARLARALALVDAVGPAVIDRTVTGLASRLAEVVEAYGGRLVSRLTTSERAGIVSFTLPGYTPADVGHALAGVGITASVRRDHVRLAPHATTSPAVVEWLETALKTLTRAGRWHGS